MQKNFFIIIGILIALLPFLSIPHSYKTPIYIVLGAIVAITSYRERYLKKKLISIPHIKRFKKSSPSTPILSDMSVKNNSPDENTISKDLQK